MANSRGSTTRATPWWPSKPASAVSDPPSTSTIGMRRLRRVEDELLERLAALRDDQQAERRAAGDEASSTGPPAGDELLVGAERGRAPGASRRRADGQGGRRPGPGRCHGRSAGGPPGRSGRHGGRSGPGRPRSRAGSPRYGRRACAIRRRTDRAGGPPRWAGGPPGPAAGRRDEVGGPPRSASADASPYGGRGAARPSGRLERAGAARRGAAAGRVRVARTGRRTDGRPGAGRRGDRAGRPATTGGRHCSRRGPGAPSPAGRSPGPRSGAARPGAPRPDAAGRPGPRASDGRWARPRVRPDSARRRSLPRAAGLALGLGARFGRSAAGRRTLATADGFAGLAALGGLARPRRPARRSGAVPVSHGRPRRSGASAARRACPRR